MQEIENPSIDPKEANVVFFPVLFTVVFFLEAEGGDVTLAAGCRLGSVNLSAAGSEAVMLLSEPNVGELGHEHNTGSGRSGLTCRYSEFIIIDCEEWHHIPEMVAVYSAQSGSLQYYRNGKNSLIFRKCIMEMLLLL